MVTKDSLPDRLVVYQGLKLLQFQEVSIPFAWYWKPIFILVPFI